MSGRPFREAEAGYLVGLASQNGRMRERDREVWEWAAWRPDMKHLCHLCGELFSNDESSVREHGLRHLDLEPQDRVEAFRALCKLQGNWLAAAKIFFDLEG